MKKLSEKAKVYIALGLCATCVGVSFYLCGKAYSLRDQAYMRTSGVSCQST